MKWIAILTGGYIVSPSLLLTGNGVAVKYLAELDRTRKLWMSERFVDKHAALAGCIRGAIADYGGRKFSLMDGNFGDFAEARQTATRQRNPTRVAFLLTNREKDVRFSTGRKESSCDRGVDNAFEPEHS